MMFAAADEGFSLLFSCFYSDYVFFSLPVDDDKLVLCLFAFTVILLNQSLSHRGGMENMQR